MKPLSELAQQFRASRAHTYSSENADHYRGFDAGQLRAAESLEAWLREADVALDRAERSRGTVLLAWVRQKLLGTTQEVK